MKAVKTVIGHLEKCYALGTFLYDGVEHIAVAAEKRNACYTFDTKGQRIDVLWEEPGGVMTLAQVPGAPILLATHKFYSPNDSSEASIVYCQRINGQWRTETLCSLPFVHRFGILQRNNHRYLIACTIKSAHAFKNDWTCPGRVWVAPFPEDITAFSVKHPLKLQALMSGLIRNHGFEICYEGKYSFAVIASDNGVFSIKPPANTDDEWSIDQLLDTPASDILYLDFDGDGERELLVLSPFHGSFLTIYKKVGNVMQIAYSHVKEMPFLHAIWGAEIGGCIYAFIGCREGDRDLIALHYDRVQERYVFDTLDKGAGAANVLYVRAGCRDLLFAANRETDEIAMYTLEV